MLVGRLLFLRTGIVLPVSVSTAELGGLALLVATGAFIAIVPAWTSYRQSISTALRT
jgi:hypothetical protein